MFAFNLHNKKIEECLIFDEFNVSVTLYENVKFKLLQDFNEFEANQKESKFNINALMSFKIQLKTPFEPQSTTFVLA